MMRRVAIPLPAGSNMARDGQDGAARLVNGYSEMIGDHGKSQYANYAIDGLSRFATLDGAGGVRAVLALSDDDLMCVAGRQLFRVDQTGSHTAIGGIASDGLCTMARNRASVPQVIVVADGSVWYYQGGTFGELGDADLPPPNSVTQVSGYFVFTCSDGRWFISAPDDLTIDGLDFTTAAGNPDPLLRGFARGQDLLLFGTRSIEAWQDVGGDPFPFARTTTIALGCLSAASVCEVDQTVGFIAHDGTVRLLSGYQAEVISTHELERLIADDAASSSIAGFAWTARGHTFFGLTGSDWTRVYDLKTGKWHERQSYGQSRWRCGSAVQFGTKRVLGHISSPYLFVQDADLYTEDDDPIVWSIQTAPQHASPGKLRVSALHIDAIVGVGTGTGDSQDIDPQLMLSYADDGAHTFSAERMLSVGAQGARRTQIKAFRLGVIPHTGRTWRLSMSAAVVKGVMGLSSDVDALRG